MGSDKTQFVFGGKTLMARSCDALKASCDMVFAMLGATARSVPQGVLVLYDDVPGQGPLRGVATGLAAARDSGAARAVVLSSDLPLITAALVGELLEAFDALPAEAVIAADGTRAHPLVGVYSTALAEEAARALHRGERGMMRFLDTHDTRKTMVRDPLALSNVNTPQEWAAIARLRSEL
jgi:molybdopterin-guanine dinucleotide biosynthesis protein A